MKKICVIVLSMLICTPSVLFAGNDLEDILGTILDTAAGGEGGLSEGTIIKGLVEALEIGTGNAVDLVGKLDGYYQNPLIKIPLPKELQQAEALLELAGYGEKLNEFKLSMNRAAESAAPQAKTLFMDAIKQMTFSDAEKILKGRDNEATLFFKDKMYSSLFDIFSPVIHDTMAKVGVTKNFQDIEVLVRTLPVAGLSDFSLDNYVTDQALDGLFSMVAEEERKIRSDPAARVTDILKEVFGK